MLTRIVGGHVIDPASGRDEKGDVWIGDGRIGDSYVEHIDSSHQVGRDFQFEWGKCLIMGADEDAVEVHLGQVHDRTEAQRPVARYVLQPEAASMS